MCSNMIKINISIQHSCIGFCGENEGYASVSLWTHFSLAPLQTARNVFLSLCREEGESKPIGSEQESSCHFLCRENTYTLLAETAHS